MATSQEIYELADSALHMGATWHPSDRSQSLIETLERIRDLCNPNTGELVVDVELVASEISKHIDGLSGVGTVVIGPDNYEQVSIVDARIQSHMRQIEALAVCTAPKRIQTLVQTAHEVASKKYAAMQPKEE